MCALGPYAPLAVLWGRREMFEVLAGAIQLVGVVRPHPSPATAKGNPGRRCQAYLADFVDPRPPDLPAAIGQRLRVIKGGKM